MLNGVFKVQYWIVILDCDNDMALREGKPDYRFGVGQEAFG